MYVCTQSTSRKLAEAGWHTEAESREGRAVNKTPRQTNKKKSLLTQNDKSRTAKVWKSNMRFEDAP